MGKRLIETHSKTTTNLVALILSIGGWFLWNIILAAGYPADSAIYYVRSSFFDSFGQSFTWWLTLILILASVHVFELAVAALRATFLPEDADVFQTLEKDPEVKRRFEEASAEELQLGWERGEKDKREKQDEEGKEKEGNEKEKESETPS